MSDVKFELDGVEYQLPNFISIENYVKIFKIKDILSDEYFGAKLVSIMSGAQVDKLLETNYQHVEYLASYIMSLFPQGEPQFIDKFELDGIDYGFLPSWKKVSFAEFVDLDTLMSKKSDEMLNYIHIMTSIMYRPIITDPSKHDFEIEKYNSESMIKRAELFNKELDIKYFMGAQFFFIKFASKYLEHIQSSLTTTSLKEQIKFIWKYRKLITRILSKKDSGGTLSSTELLTMTLQSMNKSSQSLWSKFSTKLRTSLKRTKK